MADTRQTALPSPVEAGYLDESGALAWILSLDHKRVAVMQLAAAAVALALGTLLGLVMRVEHLSPAQDLTAGVGYARLFTLHGTAMLFLFALPGIPATLGCFVVPLQIRAFNVAFPRLHLASLHLWLLGALLLLVSTLHGAVHAGWTLYPPYSLGDAGAVAPHALGVIVLAASAALRALVLIVTIHTQRGEGVTWRGLSTFTHSVYAYSWVVVIAAPVLVLTLCLLLLERTLGAGLFDAALGGDPLLYQSFFWFAAHGLLVAPILPAIGVGAEVFAAFGAPTQRSRSRVAAALAALALLSVLAWGGHLSSGHSVVLAALYSLLGLLALVPLSVLLGSFLHALRAGAPRLTAPMLFALVFASTLLIAGLSAAFLAVLGTGVHLHGTTFVTAHAHYMLAGALLSGFLAGLHYWWPKISGRRYDERTARWGAGLLFVGTHLALFPELVAGSRGLPRRLAAYPAEFAGLEQLAGAGALVLATGVVLTGLNLLRSLGRAADASANPWDVAATEWTTASPPPVHNFSMDRERGPSA